MQESLRHVKLLSVRKAQLLAVPVPVGRAALANVDDDVKKTAPATANQLCLRMRRCLKMQTSNCANVVRERMIVLNKLNVQSLLLQGAFIPTLGKKPTVIAVACRRNRLHARNWCLSDLHWYFPAQMNSSVHITRRIAN